MENRIKCRRRRRAELPEVIIQHIQSFLEPKEAAQTILVSKSWVRAWKTRPFVIFDLRLEKKYEYLNVSDDVIDRTLESYVEKGIQIVGFHLFFDRIQERWLKLARQSNVIELVLAVWYNWTPSSFQEIFLTGSLKVLKVVCHGFRFVSNLNIMCLNLKKIEFIKLQISEATFYHIMSSCPLIQELMLEKCNLIDNCPSYDIGIQSFMFAGECTSLKRLSMVKTQINDEQLHTILSKSPQLEDLNIIRCRKLVKPINLSIVSLKRVNLDLFDRQLVLADVPNLHKLKFNSSTFRTIPFPITITSPIIKEIVKVTIIYCENNIDESWFIGLKEFLAKFAKSIIKLTSYYGYFLRTDFKVLRETPLPPSHEVETLRFKGFQKLPLLYAFFNVCHPKNVILDCRGIIDSMSSKFLMDLLKDISYRGNLKCCNFNDQNKCWRHYIKRAKLHYVEDNEKKPLDMNGIGIRMKNQELVTLAIEW